MTIWKILLIFLICNICCGEEIFVRMDKNIYRIANTHSFELSNIYPTTGKILVSKYRDLFLEPVKFSVKSPIPSNFPSNLHVGQEIKLKSDGKFLTAKINSFDKYFIVSDLKIKRGDSGKIVFDSKNIPIGLVSHYKKSQTFIVRIDNLSKDEFETLTPSELHADHQIFNKQKEYEYLLLDGLKKSSSHTEMKRFLNNNLRLKKEYTNWHSTYLKKMYNESQKNISAIINAFSKHEK